jgi:hypothetical protein
MLGVAALVAMSITPAKTVETTGRSWRRDGRAEAAPFALRNMWIILDHREDFTVPPLAGAVVFCPQDAGADQVRCLGIPGSGAALCPEPGCTSSP